MELHVLGHPMMGVQLGCCCNAEANAVDSVHCGVLAASQYSKPCRSAGAAVAHCIHHDAHKCHAADGVAAYECFARQPVVGAASHVEYAHASHTVRLCCAGKAAHEEDCL